MEINVKLEITRETLESIFVTALEGGSNHWYYISEDTYRLIRAYIPKEEEPILSLALFSCVYDYDVPLAINDAENPNEEPIGFLCFVCFHISMGFYCRNPDTFDVGVRVSSNRNCP